MRDLRFNQGFPLYRERLSGMLRCIADGKAISDEEVGAYIGVNPYMVEGIRGWFCKTGLGSGTSRSYTLSPIGQLIADYDPHIDQLETHWLLHYFLVSEHEERSEIWYRAFNEFLVPNQTFTADMLQEHVLRSLDQTPKNKAAVQSDTKELIKTYTNSAALGHLGLLRKLGKTELVVGQPQLPHTNIVAFVLFDSWQRRFGALDTVRFGDIQQEPESIGRVFQIRESEMRSAIYDMQSRGMLTFADTQHQSVTRRFHSDPIGLIEQYYHHG